MLGNKGQSSQQSGVADLSRAGGHDREGPEPSQLKLVLWLCEEQYISWPEWTVGVKEVREVGNGEAIRGVK